jgi:mono/diheme cytochrome c family protein
MRLLRLSTFLSILLFTAKISIADVAEGEKLFTANCTACHAINDRVVGPALKDADKRHSETWLIKWVKNSQALVKAGDAEALKVYNEYNQSVMPPFASMTDAQIKSIFEYVKTGGAKPKGPEGPEGPVATAPPQGFYNSTTLIALGVMAVFLLIIVVVLIRIRNTVNDLYAQKYPERVVVSPEDIIDPRTTLKYKLFKKHPTVGYMAISTLFMLILAIYGFDYGNKKVGVQKGYAPIQPIAYSHELHAGQFKINCLYCHSGADKGKQATIPSPSTCMNCHMHVTASEKYNGKVSLEIQKIYNATGWDSEKRAYDPLKPKTPIKWVRIHNLPDLAYFNHAQHVKVGKVECQACHGPIETMKVVSQQASLQMGWCINCHREAKVDVASNDYYDKMHSDMKAEGKTHVTVAQAGGLECGKCHY